jgi:hypothetical protein
MTDSDTDEWKEIGQRRRDLMRAMRVHNAAGTAELLRLMRAADSADLEWLIKMVDEQVRNIPANVFDPASRNAFLKEAISRRSWINSLLHDKRMLAARKRTRRNRLIRLGVGFAAAAAAALALF